MQDTAIYGHMYDACSAHARTEANVPNAPANCQMADHEQHQLGCELSSRSRVRQSVVQNKCLSQNSGSTSTGGSFCIVADFCLSYTCQSTFQSCIAN